MQISSINTQSFKCNLCDNSQRIHQLEQKRQEIQWASEGCNGSLSSKDQYELDLRREYQALQGKAAALQWASEGCNASLPAADLIRMSEIEQELQALEPKKAPVVDPISRDSIYDVPSGNIYGVPDHTFWGEWAR
jgi:hypothetical protein